MPRPLVFGNGTLLIQCDRFGVIRDLCYPSLGYPNHLSGNKINLGFYASGHLSWIDDESWEVEMAMDDAHPHGLATLRKEGWEIRFRDAVDAIRPHFIREIDVIAAPEGAKMYVTSHFDLAESDIGNTVYFAPGNPPGMIHYKGHIWIQVALDGGEAAHEYACGQIGFGGYEGTRRDAEDGHLSQNAIAQGSVDATQGIPINAGQTIQLHIACAPSRYQLSLEGFALQTYAGDPFKKSLAILLSQIDFDGAIVAANDSDIMDTNRANYGYCWMRDGSLVAGLLQRIGLGDRTASFLRFCDRCYEPDLGFFLQKYRSDATVGASWHPWTRGVPFQEDETASALSLACAQPYLPAFARPATEAILGHIDPATGLPRPSFDLWEERLGVHTYTVATVIRALKDAAKAFGQDEIGARCQYAAQAMTDGLRRHLFDQQRGAFFRRLDENGDPDPNIDASTLHVVLHGILAPDDPMAIANLRTVEETLWVDTMVGGLARYEDDYYFRRDFNLAGNPWIITTLWLARSQWLAGNHDRARELLDWTKAREATTGVLPEQVDPHTGEHLSVSPLTWSHSEYIETQLLLGA